MPKTYEELEALPSVGHKTAAVVMAQAYGIPTFPVDTIFIDLCLDGDFQMGKTSLKRKRMLKGYFQKNYGINCIYK